MKIYRNFDITPLNSYKVNSAVAVAVFPESKQEVIDALVEYPNAIIVGGGNNIILSKSRYETPFVFIGRGYDKYRIDEGRVVVCSGIMMPQLSEIAAGNSLCGFETFWDIPGTVGGGVTMNAGAGDQFISDYLIVVEAFDRHDGQLKQFAKDECEFAYRNSIFKHNRNLVVLEVTFEFPMGVAGNIREKMDCIKLSRESKQPKELPNAGSVFKRPLGYYVGTMIEELGLKGYSVGGAQISEKHAGFIVNRSNATGEDIIGLIQYIQKVVKQEKGIELETEQIII